ncbi:MULTISPECIES: PepSY-like domain-containing protein [unclassified Campylobacter]|uniref:PepSY-like domain-containing protein n=1 Tax=unclassified Campylobacter TaxID=2593542 RepID=UPI001237C55E|nr:MULTISPECIES: PepSY-like domain-containing protein [unclassified Campylobacter]KAA6225159.1 hypothetical protein FMM55_07730 [Campylobacter sp. LR196d]KAA6226173.1 hypothetical protein FMM54_05110 [Campylobacter sp. LR185c]KAA6228121.1 hypothetical protein FMM57_03800 [Campylobacter sp. LR286c]KAA6231585.1 hypothetical protein FMM58_03050 [Campylobacter sp. LR291e]KAA8604670.1 hypothetical protein CGP82_01745 [Campylobacter sp. LR185c]
MKLKLGLCAMLLSGLAYAYDVVIPANQLPANAQSFINTYFKGVTIGLVKKDLDSYDVTLADGTEIDFIITGEWKDVDGKYKAIPTDFLPANVVQKASSTQAGAQIIQVEKEVHGYKFKFNNGMKVYTDANGNILGQKFD